MERYNNLLRMTFVFFAIILSEGIAAQEDDMPSYSYEEFVKDNKRWIYIFDPVGTLTYYTEGDTTIGVWNYKKLYRNRTENSKYEHNIYCGALREQNRVVYWVKNGNEIPDILYFFRDGQYASNNRIKTVISREYYRKCLDGKFIKEYTLKPSPSNPDDPVLMSNYPYLERIGRCICLVGEFACYVFKYCYEDSTLIATAEDTMWGECYYPTDIIDISEGNSKSPNSPTFDLTGRRICNEPRKGIYIRGGKKFIIR